MLNYLYRRGSIFILVLLMQWPFIQINAMLSTTATVTGRHGYNGSSSSSSSTSSSHSNNGINNGSNSQQHQSIDCVTNSIETSLYCRGARAMRNIINNLSKTDKPIVIVRGLEIVPARQTRFDMNNADADNETNASSTYTADVESEGHDTLIGRFSTYLRTHELNIKFSDLLAEESERYLARDLIRNGLQINGSMVYPANMINGINGGRSGSNGSDNDGSGNGGDGDSNGADIGTFTDGTANNLYRINGGDASEGKGKKDKGHGMMMMMAVMFSKLLAVMGMGGVGALAMKALGVALVALLVAGIVGLRSMMTHSYDSTPSVHYVQAEGQHHHRRRRSKNFGIITIPSDMKHKYKSDGIDIWNPQPLAYGGWHK